MIPEKEQTQVLSTMPTEGEVDMTINPEDMPWVMRSLTNLYSDKLKAVLREYATNAYDAMVMAGVKPVVRVTLPTVLNPVLKIADAGIGLSAEDIRTVYSRYGASTKRNSNDFNGQLGFGGKAALNYSEQFHVTSVKNGQKIAVVVTRKPEGGGTMNVLAQVETDEPNGTEVSIPIQRGDQYAVATKAKETYQWFAPKGSVLVDGETVPTWEERLTPMKISDTLYVSRGTRASRVVMGNVAYPAPALDGVLPNGSLIAFVEIGEVEFTQAREGLRDTPGTVKKLEEIREYADREIANIVQRDIDTQPCPRSAIKTLSSWENFIPSASKRVFTYKGRPILDHYEAEGPILTDEIGDPVVSPTGHVKRESGWQTVQGMSYTSNRAASVNGIPRDEWSGTVFVLGYTPQKFNAGHKKKLNALMDQLDERYPTQYALTRSEKLPPSPAAFFIDRANVVQWEDARKIPTTRRERNGVLSGRIPGSYDLGTEEGYKSGVPGSQIRRDKPIFYGTHSDGSSARWAALLNHLHPDGWTLVSLGLNRVAKFARIVPESREIRTAMVEARDKFLASVDEDTKVAHAFQSISTGQRMRTMDPQRVNDPRIKAAILIANKDVSKFEKRLEAFRCGSLLYGVGGVAPQKHVDTDGMFADAPLFSFSTLSYNPDHVYDYLNWVAAKKTAGL